MTAERYCPNWCGIWYWTTSGKRPRKAQKPYTGEVSYLRMRAMFFCSRACAIAGEPLRPAAGLTDRGGR